MPNKNTFKVIFTTKEKQPKFGSKKCIQTTVTTFEGLNLKGLKRVLIEYLDVAILPGGKPYRPESADISSTIGQYAPFSAKDLEAATKLYQLAYDTYKSIVDFIVKNKENGALTTEFKPFSMDIEITVQ